MIANGKYLLFDLKFMALPKGIGSKAFAFDRLKNEFSCSLARI
jgi:hypothetical protein